MLRVVRTALAVGILGGLLALTGCWPIPVVPLPTYVFARNTGTTVEVVYCGSWTFKSTGLRRGPLADFDNDAGGVGSEIPWAVRIGEPVVLTDIVERLGLDFDTSPLRPGERLDLSTVHSMIAADGATVDIGTPATFIAPKGWTQDQVDAAWFRSDRTLGSPSC